MINFPVGQRSTWGNNLFKHGISQVLKTEYQELSHSILQKWMFLPYNGMVVIFVMQSKSFTDIVFSPGE